MAVYAAHILFWLVFGAANLYARLRSGNTPPPSSASGAATPNDTAPLRAPNASLLVALHGLAFGSFASWRIRAQLDAGHQLATGGPFRVIRNPIYSALNFLALGTAIWVGGVLVWIAVLLTILGSELRARAEEPLLERAFGEEYRDYRRRTKRFVPGVY